MFTIFTNIVCYSSLDKSKEDYTFIDGDFNIIDLPHLFSDIFHPYLLFTSSNLSVCCHFTSHTHTLYTRSIYLVDVRSFVCSIRSICRLLLLR